MKYWIIAANDVASQENELQSVVKKIHWRRRYIKDQEMIDEFGAIDLPSPDSQVFTDYSSLTYETYCQWLESILDVAAIDAKLEEQMNKRLNPPFTLQDLPFDTIAIDNQFQQSAGINTNPIMPI